MSRWQPVLCADGGPAFAYTQLTDDLARQQLLESSSPGMSILADPIPLDQQLPGRPMVYAPLTLSGLTIAFNVERQDTSDPQNGTPFTTMRLTPRLVAKLLSQSYYEGIEGFPADKTHLERSPGVPNSRGLSDDPEFLDLNPEYRGKDLFTRPADAIVQLGTSDATALLWRWVVADPEAKAFLEGTPDPNGMRVNPGNMIGPGKDLQLPAPSYPRNDQTCSEVDPQSGSGNKLRTCTIDSHPFANDMHEAGRAVSRGDTLGRIATNPDPSPDPSIPPVPKFSRAPRQDAGKRSLLAVVDAATADRYGLPIALLRNPGGAFVAPDSPGLLAGAAAMKPSAVPGVLETDVTSTNSAAYPLTVLSYAAVSPPAIDKAAGADYASFLRYAAGDGQQPGVAPGQLPGGYAPLPDGLRTQTLAAATKIETEAGLLEEQPSAGPDATTGTGGGTGGTGTAAAGSVSPGSTGSGTPAAAGASSSIAGTGGAATTPIGTPPAVAAPVASYGDGPPGDGPVGIASRTPSLPAPAVGALLMALLIGGGLAAALAPVTHRLATARPRATAATRGRGDADRTGAGS